MREVLKMTPFLQSLYDMKNDAIEHQKSCKRKIKRLNEERDTDEIVSLIIQAERAEAVAGAMGTLIAFLEKNEGKEDND